MNVGELIELGDSDELLREIDRLCDRRDWPDLLLLRGMCRAATDRGKQLWGAAGHAEYRLALEASPEFAGPMVEADPGRFVLGPLTEVVASTHTWAGIVDYLPVGPLRITVAYERVLRGDDHQFDLPDAVEEFGLPLTLQDWEPAYALAEYKAHELLTPAPIIQPSVSLPIDNHSALIREIKDPAIDALYALVQPWVSESNGSVKIAAVNGGLEQVLASFMPRTADRIDAPTALASMAWAAASGGAHGTRPGASGGRAKLWWALANLADQADVWPHPSDDFGAYVDEVEWWTWDHDDLNEGWSLRIAIVDPESGMSFAIDAFDRADQTIVGL